MHYLVLRTPTMVAGPTKLCTANCLDLSGPLLIDNSLQCWLLVVNNPHHRWSALLRSGEAKWCFSQWSEKQLCYYKVVVGGGGGTHQHRYQISDTETSNVNIRDAVKVDWMHWSGDFLLNIKTTKSSPSLPSSFTVSDMASRSSFSTSTWTASLEPLRQTELTTTGTGTGFHLMDRLAKRGESSKLLADPHSINTGLLVELI